MIELLRHEALYRTVGTLNRKRISKLNLNF